MVIGAEQSPSRESSRIPPREASVKQLTISWSNGRRWTESVV